jgi:hypothetical protein
MPFASATSAASGSLRPSCFAAACIASSTASTLPLVSANSAIARSRASLASSILRWRCRSLRCRSLSFFVLPPAAGWGSGSVCCALVAASATCTAGSSVLRPMMRAGGALGRLLPCDELASPLLPAAAAAAA